MISRTMFVGASVLALAVTAPAFAQDAATTPAPAEDEFLESNDIIVTASKREATLQDTPIAVSVTSAEQIENAQVRDLIDLQTLVPSLRVSQLQSSANTNFIIRGFGNGANNAGIEPSVGVFIDGVYRSRSAAQIGDLPNVQRVEVLRGPQSTLFGKNASAGIISIVTREPQFEFGGAVEASYGNFDAMILRGNVTGPLSDTIAFSLAGNINRRDGYVQDLGTGTDSNNRDRWGVRGQLLWEPSDSFKLRIIGDYDDIDEVCCAVVNVVDGPTGNAVRALGGRLVSNSPFARTQWSNFDSVNDIQNYGVSAQATANVGAFEITGIGAYRAVRSFTDQDSDFTSADLIGSNANDTSIDTYTFEGRIASDWDGPLNFLLGGFVFHEEIDIEAQLTFGRDFRNYANLLSGGGYIANEALLRALNGIPATVRPFGSQGLGRFENYDYTNSAISIFGQVDFEITDGLVLTLGGNYTHDEKEVATNNTTTDTFSTIDLVQTAANAGIPGSIALPTGTIFPRTTPCVAGAPAGTCNPFLAFRPLQFLPGFLNFPNAVESGETSDNDFSYTIRLAYEINDNLNVYATYATGFKATSFNLSTDSRPFASDFIPGSPAQVPAPAASPIRTALGTALPNNLTTGTRYAEPEESEVYEVGLKAQFPGLAFNLAVFQQTLTNFQGNVFVGTGFVLSNADEQSTFGVEFDARISPADNLSFFTAVTYLKPEYDSYPGGSALIAPSYSVVPRDLSGTRPAGIPDWTVAVGGNYALPLNDSTDLVFNADYYMEGSTQITGGLTNFRRSTENLSASLTLAFDMGLEVTAWGRNLTNDRYITTLFPSVAQAGSLSGYRNQPRTYGISAKYSF